MGRRSLVEMMGNKVIKIGKSPFGKRERRFSCCISVLHLIIVIFSSGTFAPTANCQTNSSPLPSNVSLPSSTDDPEAKVTDDEMSKKKMYEERLMDQLMRETLRKLKDIEEKKYPLQVIFPISPVLFPSMSMSSMVPSSSDFFSISERVTALKNVFDSILSIEKDLTWNPVVPSRMSRGFFLVKLFSNLLKIMPFQEVSHGYPENILRIFSSIYLFLTFLLCIRPVFSVRSGWNNK